MKSLKTTLMLSVGVILCAPAFVLLVLFLPIILPAITVLGIVAAAPFLLVGKAMQNLASEARLSKTPELAAECGYELGPSAFTWTHEPFAAHAHMMAATKAKPVSESAHSLRRERPEVRAMGGSMRSVWVPRVANYWSGSRRSK